MNWKQCLYVATKNNMRKHINGVWTFLFLIFMVTVALREWKTILNGPFEALLLTIFYSFCAVVAAKIHTAIAHFALSEMDLDLENIDIPLTILSFLSIFPLLTRTERLQLLDSFNKKSFPDNEPPSTTGSAVEPTEDVEIAKARKLAEIEMQKAENMTRLRLAEAQGLAEIAADVAEKEEARQDRQLDKLTKI